MLRRLLKCRQPLLFGDALIRGEGGDRPEPRGPAGDTLRRGARDAVQRLRYALGKDRFRPIDFHFGVRAVVIIQDSAAMGQSTKPEVMGRAAHSGVQRRLGAEQFWPLLPWGALLCFY